MYACLHMPVYICMFTPACVDVHALVSAAHTNLEIFPCTNRFMLISQHKSLSHNIKDYVLGIMVNIKLGGGKICLMSKSIKGQLLKKVSLHRGSQLTHLGSSYK